MAGQLNIQASPLPFSNKRILTHAPVGSSVKFIVDQICPAKLKNSGVGAIVMINGHIILQRNWKRVRPKEGTVINVRIVPTGGGGKKNPLATLLAVAVLIAAPYAAAAYGAAVGTALGVSTAIGGALVSAGVGVVGMLLQYALAPPPKPSSVGVNNPAESPTLFIEGAQNQLNPFGVVPINLGINRMVPPKAGRPVTESEDNKQFVRELFSWGVGNKIAVSDLKIGETALEEFDNYEVQHRFNGDLHLGTGLYPNDPYQEDFSVLLQQADSYATRQTQTNADEAIVDFTFINGLARFATSGKRKEYTVQLEVQYALAGTSPLVWTPYVDAFKTVASFSDTVDDVHVTNNVVSISGADCYVGYRKDVLVIDKYSGSRYIINGIKITDDPTTVAASPPATPAIPSNAIRLASFLVRTKQVVSTGVSTTTVETFNDDRDAALYGTYFDDSGAFIPSHIGTTINVTDGGLSVSDDMTITASQTEALRVSKRVVFPARGSYMIRARRVTADTDSDQILDKVYLTAIKSITYRSPVVEENCNGTALRIQGTDQLNGTINQFNGIVSSIIPDYDVATDTWVDRISNNPASLYLYVLQGCGNKKPLADSKINFDDFIAWHAHCMAQGYTYNRVIDYETNVDDVLRDVASAGAASPAIVDGKRTIAVDQEKDDIVQIITPRNSWNYNGEMTFPDLPHAFRVQFRNKDKGYMQDERIVYDDGYNEDNAEIFETLELQNCTDSDLAFMTGRRHIASVRLRPEIHSVMLDVENLVALRGDRIKLAHDIPITAVGDGRVKAVTMTGGSPNLVASISIDDTISIPDSGTYYVRVRLFDGSFLYKQLTTTIGMTSTLTFATPFAMPYNTDSPALALLNTGDLLYVVEAGGEVDLIITKIEPQDDLSARITALDYAQPDIANAANTSIPTWSSNITTPLEFIRPLPPVLLTTQSDETAMLKNSDGSYIQRAIFTLDNPNSGDVSLMAQVRLSGTDVFTAAQVLESSAQRIVLTGLQDDTTYDVYLRYKRVGSDMFSVPLQINNFLFVGASGTPSDVQNFMMTVSGTNALFVWDANPEIDIDHYTIEYSGLFSGVTWATAQVLQETIYENRITLPFQAGTYMIKAVDILGNESANATAVITFDADSVNNVVSTLTEHSSFSGTKTNVTLEDVGIVLSDPDLIDGYYYFANSLDLTSVFVSSLSASILASGVFVNNIFDITDIFAETDLFGSGGADLFDEDDMFALDDAFGIGANGWSIELQYRVTDLDPTSSPSTFGDWTAFTAGNLSFRAIQFRLKLTSLAINVSPKVTALSVRIDMPDRIERGTALSCPAIGGATILYPAAFKNDPSVGITLQNAATDDKIVFSAKTSSGFSFTVYNQTLAANVTRTYDYISSGYGRVNS